MKRPKVNPLYAVFVNGKFTGHILPSLEAKAYCRGWNRAGGDTQAKARRIPHAALCAFVSGCMK